jgi:integrase
LSAIDHALFLKGDLRIRIEFFGIRQGDLDCTGADEARELLDSIAIARNTARDGRAETDEPALIGLRDRALIGVMVYTFARINAVLQMKVRDYFVQGCRGWVRLHEKGGKEHEVPCHHSLEQYLDEYIAAAGIAGEPDAPLFQTAAGKTGTLTGKAMWQQDAYRMIQRRTRGTGDQDREPYFPGDRHHRVPEEQGHA